MKLSNISIIFIIIMIPIILVFSYYLSLQIDTINMQTSYSTKQLEATKEAIEAFEINTVEWNEAYSENADSKRRDIMASINTFTTSFANSIGIGGTNREYIEGYIPAIACTLYDGYYIYTPSQVKSVIKDKNGVAVFLTESIVKSENSSIDNYAYQEEHEGKLLYEYDSENEKGISADGIYNGIEFTLNPNGAKSTYEHILKPYSTYSARYKTSDGKIDITVNYTLDNYITIYGNVSGEYVVKSGYLIVPRNDLELSSEKLTEKIWYKGLDKPREFTYVYAEDNTKVYFDGDTTFQVSSTGERTDLNKTTSVKYKKVRTHTKQSVYQALNNGTVKIKNEDGEFDTIEIIPGNIYSDKKGTPTTNLQENIIFDIDYSSRNYFIESTDFTEWVKDNLGDITIGDMQGVQDISIYGNATDKIFDISQDPESDASTINTHKREIIKQTLISNLNQAITSYSRNSEGEYRLPVLEETDWDHVLRNVSIITFVQDLPIGMKYYNNYAIATSTSNKEYTNPDEIYLTREGDSYYHLPYCSHLSDDTSIIGYTNTDYVIKSYETEANGIENTNYYYKHSDIANEACYYCLVQRDLYSDEGLTDSAEAAHEEAYKVALARERYRNISEIDIRDVLYSEYTVYFDYNYEGSPEPLYEQFGYYEQYGQKLPYPTREGYQFIDWFKDKMGENPVNYTQVVQDSHTLYAQWDANPYSITYAANGGQASDGSISWAELVIYDRNYQVKSNWYQKTGYSFAGWNEKDDGTGEKWEEGSIKKWEWAHNVTLFAQWEPNKYKVTLDANEGSVDPQEITVAFDGIYGTLPEPTREGYTFNGWFTEKDAGTQIIEEGEEATNVTTAANHTIYAQWTPNTYRIEYDANGGIDAPEPDTKTHGVDLTLSTKIPTKNNYNFLGWSTSSTGSVEYAEAGTFTTNANTTLYAVWEKAVVSVTGVTLSQTGTHWIPLTGGSLPLTATVSPSDATNKEVKWEYNPHVVTVSDGTVTAEGAGSTTITVTTNDGSYKASVDVVVYNAIYKNPHSYQATKVNYKYDKGYKSNGVYTFSANAGAYVVLSHRGESYYNLLDYKMYSGTLSIGGNRNENFEKCKLHL